MIKWQHMFLNHPPQCCCQRVMMIQSNPCFPVVRALRVSYQLKDLNDRVGYLFLALVLLGKRHFLCESVQNLVPSVSFWSFLFASLVKRQTCHKGNDGRNSPACASEPVAASSIVITTLCGASHGGVPYLCWQYM